ncbi:MAG: DedA family protein [Bdellovibrionales bacterium]|nr:DedA family protein [Bdellovibrionales bacterium]
MEASALANHLIEFLQGLDGITAYAAILGLLLISGLGVPLPEDITLIGSGILAAMGAISLPGAIIAGFIGVLLGDAFLFTLGRKYGRAVFDLPGFRRVFTSHRIALAEEKVLSNSQFICFTARFLPGLRAPIYLTAGVLGVRPTIFYLLDGLAALISVPLWVVLGWWFTLNVDVDTGLYYAKKAQIYLVITVLCVVSGYVFYRYWRREKKTEMDVG